MADTLLQIFLAAALSAARGSAFLMPGGIVNHVRVRGTRPASLRMQVVKQKYVNRPLRERLDKQAGNARYVQLQQVPVHNPHWADSAPGHLRNIQHTAVRIVPAPEKVGKIEAVRVIAEWTGEAEALRQGFSWKNKVREERHMKSTLATLHDMSTAVALGTFDYVFSLTADGEPASVLAIAAVTSSIEDDLDGESEVLHIDELLARPAADQPVALGAELIRKIIDWADATGRQAVVGKGFEAEALQAFYSLQSPFYDRGHDPKEPPSKPDFHMTTLAV